MAYIGKQPVVGNFVKLDAITTSATATYNLTNGGVAYSPQSANHCIVSLNGVIQEPTSASNVGGFTISGSTIVFTSALTSLDVIDFILVLGDVLNIGTPSDATVGFAKVTSNLITGATAETTIAGADSVLIYDDSASALRKMTVANFGNTPAFSVYLTNDQVISNATVTKITLDAESFDTDNAFASNRFTVPAGKAGKYLFIGTITFVNLTDNDEGQVRIHKNGSLVQGSAYFTGQNGTVTYQVSTVETLAVSDYIELFAYQVSGGNISADGGVEYTNLKGFRLTGM